MRHHDTLEIELDAPLQGLKGGDVVSLCLREPTAGEYDRFLKNMQQNGAYGAMLLLLADMSGVLQTEIKKVGVRKIAEADRFISGFLRDSPEDGD